MDRVERYIEAVSRHLDGNAEELDNLKEEIRAHINESIKELQDSGKSKDESITIALNRFGEENKIEQELLKEFKYRKDIKKPIIIISLLAVSLIIASFIFRYYKASIWDKVIIAPDAITIRNKFNAPLIPETIMFEGQVEIDDKEVIDKLIEIIKEGKYARSCSANEAINFNSDDISFSIGTVVFGSEIPTNTLATVNIFKDGTFIAGKSKSLHETVYIKGKLKKGAVEYLEKIYTSTK